MAKIVGKVTRLSKKPEQVKYYYQTAAPDLGHLTYNITNELLIHSQDKVERKTLQKEAN